MNTVDNTPVKNPLTHAQKNVLAAFFQGHIITINKEEYRFAEKDDLLYTQSTSEGEMDYIAMDTGIFKRFYSFSGTDFSIENADSFKWMLCASEIGHIMSLIKTMTQDEVFIALSNKTLTEINQTKRAG
jgi:hypothetical protein